MNGFFFLDKPRGPTSHDLVRQVRRCCNEAKVGHSGTLDPMASGLLICAVGDATRLLPYVPDEPKRYAFGMQFGTETDTLDAEGKTVASGGRVPCKDELTGAIPVFCGKISQTPPRFSAVRVGGERAYDLARANRDFELQKREITVFELSVLAYDKDAGQASLDVTCSGGTYVRSLVKDIAAALGTIAHASFIRRLAMGPFSVEQAFAPEALVANAAGRIVAARMVLQSLPSFELSEKQLDLVATGASIYVGKDDPVVIAYDDKGNVAAVLKPDGELYHPDKVFVRR
jgi:tRNA pseudouridine55 synthase